MAFSAVSVSTGPLGYTGLDPYTNPPLIIADRAPTSNDLQLQGTQWLDRSATPDTFYITSGNGTWIPFGNAAGSFSTLSVSGASTLTGAVTTNGNLTLNGPATQLRMQGGAATDFIGSATLVAGTVTIANTNIAAGDRILIQRVAANASTTLGELSYTISAGASFTINSLILGTPGSVQTGDLSSVAYFIVREI